MEHSRRRSSAVSPIFPKLSGCLRERPFRLLFIGQGASVLGDAMATIAVAFAVIDLTGSKADLGRVLMARTIPLVILLILGGVIADRLPRRALMLGSDLTRFACQAALAALLFSGNATIAWMMALMAVYGTAEALFRPALSGLTPQTVSAPRLQEAMALLGMTPAVP
jgi:MFS family permease